MEVTDENAIPFINQTSKDGAIVMGLTARGKEHLSATLMQLKDNKFTTGNDLIFKKIRPKIRRKNIHRWEFPLFTI